MTRKKSNDFDTELRARIAALEADGLLRELRRVESPQGTRLEIAGRALLNFSSNDYLGFAKICAPSRKKTRSAAPTRSGRSRA
ncbi:MAG: hypothetical protein HY301_09210 [Verrucomicrobia bacterium]|nr:hypothetical protein [Verrucomicrobiota bacterium]